MSTYDLATFGPHRDGRTLDTAAVQAGIDAVHESGGGLLRIGPGDYRTGGLLLRDGVVIELEAGATLIASGDYGDFHTHAGETEIEGSCHALLYARGARGIGLRGRGRVVGSADDYFDPEPDADGYRRPHQRRPRMVLFEGCERVVIEDVTFEQAPFWTVHLVACTDVSVLRVTVDNDLTMANTDAIDIDGCRRVRIADCRLSAADDGVCVKTTSRSGRLAGPASGIIVTGCDIRSTSCAVKIGTETYDDVEHVVVSNCVLASNRGIGLFSRDGGALRHVLVSGITFDCRLAPEAYWGKAEPVHVSAGRRDPARAAGVIEHVRFAQLSGDADGAITLHGEPGAVVRDVVLDGVRVVQRVSGSPLQGSIDLRPVPASETGPGAAPGGGSAGVGRYPGGLPGVYARGIVELELCDVWVDRPTPLPAGWNPEPVVVQP